MANQFCFVFLLAAHASCYTFMGPIADRSAVRSFAIAFIDEVLLVRALGSSFVFWVSLLKEEL